MTIEEWKKIEYVLQSKIEDLNDLILDVSGIGGVVEIRTTERRRMIDTAAVPFLEIELKVKPSAAG